MLLSITDGDGDAVGDAAGVGELETAVDVVDRAIGVFLGEPERVRPPATASGGFGLASHSKKETNNTGALDL